MQTTLNKGTVKKTLQLVLLLHYVVLYMLVTDMNIHTYTCNLQKWFYKEAVTQRFFTEKASSFISVLLFQVLDGKIQPFSVSANID